MRAAPGLPPALGAAIDRCLARDPAGRFADGEALAAALAPAPDARPALPPTLRAWLARAESAPRPLPGVVRSVRHSHPGQPRRLAGRQPAGSGPADIVLLAAIASSAAPADRRVPSQPGAPAVPGRTHARRPAGGARDRAARAGRDRGARPRRRRSLVPIASCGSRTVGSATWLAVTFGLLASGVIHENASSRLCSSSRPCSRTMLLGAVSNALDVQFIPDRIREWWQTGIRERLWNSRAGEWLARRLGAPERSQLAGASAFRATEAALGVAASELFAALPKAYREQLAELPAIVAALEARAAEARAEIDVVAALAPSGSVDAEVAGCAAERGGGAPRRERRRAGGHPSRPAAPARGRRRSRAAHHADGRRAPDWRGPGPTRGGPAGGRSAPRAAISQRGEPRLPRRDHSKADSLGSSMPAYGALASAAASACVGARETPAPGARWAVSPG